MSGRGCILSIVAGCFLLIGLIPLLGWLNWLTSLPISLLAAIFCYQRMQAAPAMPWRESASSLAC
jgi:hypothetical protein